MRKLIEIILVIVLLLTICSMCRAGNFYLQFGGTSGYLETDQTLQTVVRSGTFAVNVWCKPTDGHKVGGQALWGNWSSDNVFLTISETGVLYGQVKVGSDVITVTEDSATFSAGIQPWTMVTLVGTKPTGTTGKLLLYVNGVLRKTGGEKRILWANCTPTQPIELGDNGSEIYFAGGMDGFGIYASSLSTELVSIYNDSTGTKYPDGIATAVYFLNMDEGSGDETTDAVGGVSVGTKNADVTWQQGGVPLKDYDRHRDRYDDNYRSRYK
jgi:hypothetical protein